MAPKMVRATKTLLVIVPLAIGVMAFQNCSPATFQSAVVSSKGENVFGDLPGQVIVPSEQPPVAQGVPSEMPVALPEQIGDKEPTLLPPTSGENLAANCEVLRAKFYSERPVPANVTDVRTSGQVEVGPLLVHRISSARSTGGSALYLVGAENDSITNNVTVSGGGHIVLCGLNAQVATVTGNAVLDLVGSNILEGSKTTGVAKIRRFTIQGDAL